MSDLILQSCYERRQKRKGKKGSRLLLSSCGGKFKISQEQVEFIREVKKKERNEAFHGELDPICP